MGENICNKATGKGLISTIRKQHMEPNIHKINNPIKKMGRRPKQTSLQRRHTDGPEVHTKMLNITNYQRNINQNYNELSLHTSQNGHHQKNLQTINTGEGVGKREPSYTVGGSVNWYSHCGEQYGGSFKNYHMTQ